MKRFRFIVFFTVVAMLLATGAVAAPAGNLIPKVASFDFLVDNSGSMLLQNSPLAFTNAPNKMETAKTVLKRVNDKIPALSYSGSLHTFSPQGTVLPLAPYNKAALDKAVSSLKTTGTIFGHLTTLGDSLRSLNAEYIKMPRKTALILVTDGDNNYGLDPYDEAVAIYANNPDICIHVISFADTPNGKETIKKIAGLRKCSIVAESGDLLKSDAAVDKFVKDVFYDVASSSTIVLRSVHFAFDSSAIDSPSAAILDELASILQKNSGSVNIDGHTCSIGSADYNLKLSQRRADSVKDYLVKKGVPSSSLTTKGYGLTQPKYDNNTEEGRRLNRRAEVYYR
jgi:OOP family OmpA-OmpF porin